MVALKKPSGTDRSSTILPGPRRYAACCCTCDWQRHGSLGREAHGAAEITGLRGRGIRLLISSRGAGVFCRAGPRAGSFWTLASRGLL
eukprot:s5472_g2.t1